jgi:hypothetical protein
MNKRSKRMILSLLYSPLFSSPLFFSPLFFSPLLSSPLFYSPLLSPSKLVWLYWMKDGANALKLSGGD